MKFIRLDQLALSEAPLMDGGTAKCVKCRVVIGLLAARAGGWCLNADGSGLRSFYCAECVEVLTQGAPK